MKFNAIITRRNIIQTLTYITHVTKVAIQTCARVSLTVGIKVFLARCSIFTGVAIANTLYEIYKYRLYYNYRSNMS